jgi:hypothetical protein
LIALFRRRPAPRIEVEDVFDEDIPITEGEHLGACLLRVRLTRPLPVSPYHRYLLEGGTDVATLLPGAKNREAVAYNLDGVRQRLREAFARQGRARLLREAGLEGETGLLRLSVQHCSEPAWLYTNGQGAVSVIERGGVFEAVPHVFPLSSLKRYLEFGSEYSVDVAVPVSFGARFPSLPAAETWIAATLGRIQLSPLSLVKGRRQRLAFLQEAGQRRGARGYPVVTYLLHDRGEVHKERVPPGESARFLNRLDRDGFRARTCATCVHFSFSRMSADMSNGLSGYCGKRAVDPSTEAGMDGLTGVFESCLQHEIVSEAARRQRSAD